MKFSELKIGDIFSHYTAGVHWICVKIDPYLHNNCLHNAVTEYRLDLDQYKFTLDDNTEVTLLKEERSQ